MTIQNIDARHYPRNIMRNIGKSIAQTCNKKALLDTNNNDVYNCIIANGNNCDQILNYIEYTTIRNDCIKLYKNQFGSGILLSAMFWISLGLFTAIMI
jgi:hypothetical protein